MYIRIPSVLVRALLAAVLSSVTAVTYAEVTAELNASDSDSSNVSRNASARSAESSLNAKLEEVVVTAQKRAEDLQEVPISVQVIGSEALAEQNQKSFTDLTQTVPGVFVTRGMQSDNLYIRGIGSGSDQPFFDQSVGTFDDDISHGRSHMNSNATFLDLDRIEILKGPQSTFFGNSAIAGALNIVTKKPGSTFDAWGRALYGQFDQYAAEGAMGGPISDSFGARLAVTRNGGRGWIKNVNTGRWAPDENNKAARLTMVYKPNENLDATLKIEGSEHKTSGTWADGPLQFTNCPPPAPFPTTFTGFCNLALAQGVPIGLNNDRNTGLPGQGNELSTFESVLTLNYHKWDDTFTSVSGFYNYHFDAQFDFANLPTYFYATGDAPEKYHQFSQEVRVSSSTGGRIEYTAGAYYQTDQLLSGTKVNLPLLDPIINAVPAFAALIPYEPLGNAVNSAQHENIYSVFASLSWNATNRLQVGGGLRGSRIEKNLIGSTTMGHATQIYGGVVPTIPAALVPLAEKLAGVVATGQNLSRTDQALMPSARIQYQINPDAMVYVRYDKGFKAGGINGNAPLGSPATLMFAPERVNAYELGLKSIWFNDRLLLNLDVFRADYTNLQVLAGVYNASLNAIVNETTNAGTSRSQGVEFEGKWVATKNFRLRANITYLDAHYVSFPNATATNLQNYCHSRSAAQFAATPQCAVFPYPVPLNADVSGGATPNAPQWSGSITASYSIPLPRGYRLTTELSPFFTSSYFLDIFAPDEPFARQGGYLRLDARLALESPGGRWNLDLIGKNLTDRIVVDGYGTGIFNATKEEPRNLAVQVRYHL